MLTRSTQIVFVIALVGILPYSSTAGDASTTPSTVVDLEAQPVCKLNGHTRWVQSLAFSPSGEFLISSSDDGRVLRWDLKHAKQPIEPTLLRHYASPVSAVAISPDGKRVAIGTWDGVLEICQVNDGSQVRELEGHSETVTSIDFHPTNKYLASGGADDRLILWDVSSGEEILTFHQGNEYDVMTVDFHPRGTNLVTGDGENQIKIWDADTGSESETLPGHTATVSSAAYSPNGRMIISGDWDNSLLLWDATTGKCLNRLPGHTGDITAVLFASNEFIISSSEDKTVRIWHVETGKPRCILKQSHEPHSLAWNSRKRLIAMGSEQEIEVFELVFNQPTKR